MIETSTYKDVLPDGVLRKYSFLETRSATKIAQAICPYEMEDIVKVLSEFVLTSEMLLTPGGNRGVVPTVLDGAFARLGWREARVDIARQAYYFPGHNAHVDASLNPKEYESNLISSTYQTGYSIDNVKGRIALDVEWNPKDGNLDRDFSAYRSWYEEGLIDAAFLITRLQDETKGLARRVWDEYLINHKECDDKVQPVKYDTSTTSNFEKAHSRVIRGDLGLCPILVVGIGENTWSGEPWTGRFVRANGQTGELTFSEASLKRK